MYLKRLELQGFKSFSNKTMFEFGTGVTAVVGPNGSGKSNVGESLRWVLGEQSSRNIRARRLEDVIFSGSSQRAAVGMAEVSITLDNSEGWLPVDYSEVVVSRRAFRNGESEYLINKNKVRLRDVLDLFLRAQVGQNSYAFMGQGLVDEVLVMRPEERRRLLEEAADVRLLRTRLDEARDRLSATRENLERVNLLIEELAPRLRQLERQATRAVEHSKLAGELASTLRELYTRLWHNAHEARAGAEALFDQRQQALNVAREEAKASEEALAALAAAAEERERELAVRRRSHRVLSDETHALEQRQTFDRERIEAQTRRRGEIEAELTSLRDERADHQRSLSTIQERIRGITPEIEDARALIQTRRHEMSTFEQEQAALRRRISDTQDVADRARRAISEVDNNLNRLTQEEARTRGNATRHAEQRRQLLAQLAEAGREFRTLRENLELTERDMLDADRERIGLAAMVETERVSAAALEREAVELNAQLSQIEMRAELLKRLQASQEGIDAGAGYLLGDPGGPDGRGSRDAVEGLIGLLRDLIRVPPGLERAIEAALAENMQALVFQSLPAALAAVEVLEQREAGRALIYPLDAVRAVPPVNLMRERGVIGVAARLVRCENEHRALVDALLGHSIVVESVQVGREMLRRGLGAVVTLDGVLLRPNGALAGGISRAAAESFTRQRELDELPGQHRAIAQRLRDVEARLSRERSSLEGSTSALARIEPRLTALRDERSRRQNALLENRGRLIVLQGQARSLQAEARHGDSQTDWPARRARLQADRQRHEAGMNQAREDLDRDRDALNRLQTRRNSSIDSVSEAAAAHANLEGESRSLIKQSELLQASFNRTADRLREREGGLRQIDAELGSLRERSQSMGVELEQKLGELKALAAEIEPAEGELNHLVTRERAMRQQVTAAQSKRLDAERAFLEAQASVKLRHDEIEGLRELMAGEGFMPQGSTVVTITAGAPEEMPNGPPPVRGAAGVDVETLRGSVAKLRNQIRGLGPVNEQAQVDYGESKERYDFLKNQVEDLTGSEETLMGAIEELEQNIRERLRTTFAVVDAGFQRNFESFFNGGKAQLSLTQPDDFANTGIEIIAQPPGKRVNSIAMLSGGERALTSLALLMSLLEAHPSPICVLDEVDAALDETNVGRFVDALKLMAQKTQFIVVTHNPRTIEAADVIYGVSMGSDSTSKVLSLRLSDTKPSLN